MDFVILSDIHLEFGKTSFNKIFGKKNYSNKILLLAGDIGYPDMENYWDFFDECNKRFKQTFFVSGNHEFYNYDTGKLTISDKEKIITEKIKEYDNIHYLNCNSIEYGNTVFLGCTLWTNIPEKYYETITELSNDYSQIYINENNLISPKDIVKLHKSQVEWLNNELEKYKNKKIIVLTHHLPTIFLINRKYHMHKELNHCYYTPLEHLINNFNISMWICGHTHHKSSYTLNNCKLIVNPYGYSNENNYEKQNDKILEEIII